MSLEDLKVRVAILETSLEQHKIELADIKNLQSWVFKSVITSLLGVAVYIGNIAIKSTGT